MKSTTFSDKDLEKGEVQINGRETGGGGGFFLNIFWVKIRLKISIKGFLLFFA